MIDAYNAVLLLNFFQSMWSILFCLRSCNSCLMIIRQKEKDTREENPNNMLEVTPMIIDPLSNASTANKTSLPKSDAANAMSRVCII